MCIVSGAYTMYALGLTPRALANDFVNVRYCWYIGTFAGGSD